MELMKVEDCPEHKAAVGKLAELLGRLADLEKRIERTAERVSGGRGIEEQASALIRGVPLDDFNCEGGLRRDFEAARRERNILRVAVEKQRVEVGKAYHAACVAIRTKLRPIHEKIAQRMAKELLALNAAIDDEQAFFDELRAMNIDPGWPLLPITPSIGQYSHVLEPLDARAYIAEWFDEVRTGRAASGDGRGYDVGKGP